MDDAVLALAAIAGAAVAAWLGLEVYLLRRELRDLRDERRRLQYEVMELSVRLVDEQDRAARRRQRWADAERRAAELKQGVEDALELLSAYRVVSGEAGLDGLRDELSEFGRMMAAPSEQMGLR